MERIERLFAAIRAGEHGRGGREGREGREGEERRHSGSAAGAALQANTTDPDPQGAPSAAPDPTVPASVADFAADLSEAVCRHFRSSHASLWLLDGVPGAYRLRCLGAFNADGPSGQSPVCDQQAYPGYFTALLGEGVFRSGDVQADPRLQGLPAATWRAILDVCGQINGRNVGVLALGQREQPRAWTKREELDLRRMTAKTCLRLHDLYAAHQPLLEAV